MTNKMTNVKALTYALENCELPADVAEKFEAMKASFEKRNARKHEGPTKAQKERMALAEKVFEALVADTPYGSADIAGLIPETEGFSSQKVTALMKGLVADGRVNAETVKGKKVYTLA